MHFCEEGPDEKQAWEDRKNLSAALKINILDFSKHTWIVQSSFVRKETEKTWH